MTHKRLPNLLSWAIIFIAMCMFLAFLTEWADYRLHKSSGHARATSELPVVSPVVSNWSVRGWKSLLEGSDYEC